MTSFIPTPRLILEINIGELLPGAVLHDEACVQFLDKPRRREAAAQKLLATYDLNWSGSARCGRDVECIRIPMTRPSGDRASHVSRLGSRLRESYDRSVAVPVVTIARAPAPPPAAKHGLISQEVISQEVIVEATMKMGNA